MGNKVFTVGPKILKLLDEKGLTQISLIRFLLKKDKIEGKERTRFNRYFNGVHEFPTDYIASTAIFLKCDPKILLEEKGEYVPSARKIPVLGLSSCGVPSPCFDFSSIDETIDYVGEEENVYAVKAFGDSMETYIFNEDIVIFESLKNNGIEDGEVVHYSYEYGSPDPDDNGIKVFKIREDGSIYLKPLNGEYDNIEVKYPEFLKMSRLVSVQKKPKRF
ncbi:S24 family peptidase [Arcobacter arenosus]|uniref:Peptidase S24/S26A/S26B/S26C domain-containing protein n=1 Tax=Arcobacter arenosus TaxID=2576037 RepID=A0A5R8Y5J9_9BACT|nr:S24 family peptidase [Arcobacter arenosus]TLP41060.1 hypothetical protein FDK22_03300 [Arcobacter arenosus]